MRLINTSTLQLEFFLTEQLPSYAILSHTWGDQEVSLEGFTNPDSRAKFGFRKIRYTCDEAKRNGIPYAWVDTCCIDKTSSAELSEAINSMWHWYRRAKVCYAYLDDVSIADVTRLNEMHDGLPNSVSSNTANLDYLPDTRWVTRGWTLQELLAPTNPERMIFFSKEWQSFGTRRSLATALSERTGIGVEVLADGADIQTMSIAKRMSWASRRNTTRSEDQAYCLLGIFDVNMPLLYGEGGEKAFIRLQKEILAQSDDESIFAWQDPHADRNDSCGLLAKSPTFFKDSAGFTSYRNLDREQLPMTSSNLGISLSVLLAQTTEMLDIALFCCLGPKGNNAAIYVQEIVQDSGQYLRIYSDRLWVGDLNAAPVSRRIHVRQKWLQSSPTDFFKPVLWTYNYGGNDGKLSIATQLLNDRGDWGSALGAKIAITNAPFLISALFKIKSFSAPVLLGPFEFFVIVGSDSGYQSGKGYRKGAFAVRTGEDLGISHKSLHGDFYSKLIGSRYCPHAAFDETVLAFNSNLRVSVVSNEQRGFHILVDSILSKPEEKLEPSTDTKPKPPMKAKASLFRRLAH